MSVSEEHPRKQGLKHQSLDEIRALDARLRGTSTKTRIETGIPGILRRTERGLRGTSTKTRIETGVDDKESVPRDSVSEEHPRKQGLKRQRPNRLIRPHSVSEEHPRKQGLKHAMIVWHHAAPFRLRGTSTKTRIETGVDRRRGPLPEVGLRGTSTKTRIETRAPALRPHHYDRVSEEHPRKQGLKQMKNPTPVSSLQ